MTWKRKPKKSPKLRSALDVTLAQIEARARKRFTKGPPPKPDRIEMKEVHGQMVAVKIYRPQYASGASFQSCGRKGNLGRAGSHPN